METEIFKCKQCNKEIEVLTEYIVQNRCGTTIYHIYFCEKCNMIYTANSQDIEDYTEYDYK